MTDEINEIIRVLQLTTYDEDEWDADQLTAMKRACNALESKLQAAIDWLEVPTYCLLFPFINSLTVFGLSSSKCFKLLC